MQLVPAAMEYELLRISEGLVAKLTGDWLRSRPVVDVLCSFQIELVLELKGIFVAGLPPLFAPVLVVALREHHFDQGDVREVVPLVNDNSD
jgi:hypothetical protein